MARSTPGNYVPLDVNYVRDVAVRRAGEAAELLFIRALAYSKGAKTGGFVSSYDLEVVAVGLRNVRVRVEKLVREGLWIVVEDGWRIRSWDRWNGTDEAFREERSASGKHGNHQRWHVKAGVVDPDCEWCRASLSDSPSDSLPESHSESLSDPSANRKGREVKETTTLVGKPPRQEILDLCTRLADRIEANGAKRPKVTQKWLDECRRLVDRDGIDPTKAARLIDWCQADPFWRANILSMPKFREQYDQLRLKALAEWEQNRGVVSPDGELNIDAILGPERFEPPAAPDDLPIGSPQWQAWNREQRDAWVADRERRARETLARRAS